MKDFVRQNTPKPILLRGIYKNQTTRYPSIATVARRLNVCEKVITTHIRNGKPLNNYIIRFENVEDNSD